jgi:hypothetical protein
VKVLWTLVFFIASCAPNPGDFAQNWSFAAWKDNQPVGWSLVAGEIARVATWHPRDSGLALVAPGTRIEQTRPIDVAREGEVRCVAIDVVADVTREADVRVTLDVGSDGKNDETQVIPQSSWAPLAFLVRFDIPATSLTIGLEKRGEGRAVIANLRVGRCD